MHRPLSLAPRPRQPSRRIGCCCPRCCLPAQQPAPGTRRRPAAVGCPSAGVSGESGSPGSPFGAAPARPPGCPAGLGLPRRGVSYGPGAPGGLPGQPAGTGTAMPQCWRGPVLDSTSADLLARSYSFRWELSLRCRVPGQLQLTIPFESDVFLRLDGHPWIPVISFVFAWLLCILLFLGQSGVAAVLGLSILFRDTPPLNRCTSLLRFDEDQSVCSNVKTFPRVSILQSRSLHYFISLCDLLHLVLFSSATLAPG